VLNILTLGSSFVLYKPHLGVSLDKLEIIYTNLMRGIQSDNDIFITQLWKKYENKARKFYENRLNPSHKVFSKLESFLTFNNLVIKEADKNLGLTVMDKDWYDKQIMHHLSNTDFYKEENPNPEKIISDLEDRIKFCNNIRIKPDKLRNREFVVPRFYILPKIHKDPVSSRPIVLIMTGLQRKPAYGYIINYGHMLNRLIV
jgi:hypothetical protein